MHPLNLPPYPFRFRSTNGKTEIFDEVRRRYVSLSPEEWVRQHFLMYLHVELAYPLTLLAVEKTIKVNRLTKRFDIAVFDNSGNAVMLVECKAPAVELSQATLDQAGRYNLGMNVPYMIITNGIKHHCFKIDKKKNSWESLDHIPHYGKP
jgi:hypothetical protein